MDNLQDTFTKICGGTVYKFNLIETRKNMGYTLTYARKAYISDMIPRNDLSSTEYCLAKEGEKCIIYQPSINCHIVIHRFPIGKYSVETLDVSDGSVNRGNPLKWKGGDLYLKKPMHVSRDWVVLIVATLK